MKKGVSTSLRIRRSAAVFSITLLGLLCLLTYQTGLAKTKPSTKATLLDEEVQFVLPGNFIVPFEQFNSIPSTGLDLDGDSNPDIIPPCSCKAAPPIINGTMTNTGLFDDQLIVATGFSGQTWYVESAYNLYDPDDLSEIPNGTIIPEVGNTGVYVLPFVHYDATGYVASVHSPVNYPDEVYGPIVNTCYYPDPVIETIDNAYCIDDPDVFLFGSATTPFDGNSFPLTLNSEFWLTNRTQDNEVFFGQVFSPSTFGAGDYVIRFTADAGNNAHFAANKTGCSVTVEQEVAVRGTNNLACNNGITVALNPVSCAVTVVPEMLLASSFDDYTLFEVEVVDPQGNSLGNTIPAEFANLTLPASVTDLCSEVTCFSTITIGEVNPPVLTIPADITISCTTDPTTNNTGQATATDCVGFELTFEDEIEESACGNPKAVITRTWTAVDDFGNTSSDVQTISIARADPADLLFPADVEYSCVAYTNNASITEPTPEGAGIPNLVDEPLCGLAYTSEDNVLTICGGPTSGVLIIRTWFVLDICGTAYITTDGAGEDNMQVIRILDNIPPTIQAGPITVGADIPGDINGLGACSATGFIPPPVVTDVCNTNFTVQIITPLGEANYINGVDGTQGAYVPEPGLQLGDHEISYIAEDECGNIGVETVTMTVLDVLEPIMICDNMIFLSLQATGEGRIFPDNIDEGSYDECCATISKVKLSDEPDSAFRDYIEFFCTNDTVEVVLRVTDCFGNFNECSSELVVEDRVSPFIAQPVQDLTLTCLEDYQNYLSETFNAPVFDDNCNFSVVYNYTESFDTCGLGTLTRTWTASDNPNNTPTTATQIITIEPLIDYSFLVPDDLRLSCDNQSFTNLEFIDSQGCELLASSTTETEVDAADDPATCFRIERIHQIINWCQYDGSAAPVIIPRKDGSDLDLEPGDSYELRVDETSIYEVLASTDVPIANATGFYQYQQWIEIYDDGLPELIYTPPAAFCSPATVVQGEDPCSGAVNFSFKVVDNCAEDVEFLYSLNLNTEVLIADTYGTVEDQGGGTFIVDGMYPVGAHALQINLFDACGNTQQFDLPFEVLDCTNPAITCTDIIEYNLNFDGTRSFTPSDLVELATDNCSALSLSFSENSSDMLRTYTCDSLGTKTLTIWATDESGNQASCSSSFEIRDDASACIEFFNITGNLATENGVKVSQSEVNLSGPMEMADPSDMEGDFRFMEVPEGQDYSLRPYKNTQPNNGVSTLDMVFINQHILGIKLLSSPYKIIAADANRSGSVSTLDQVFIRRVILGIDTAFNNNTSWRFIPEDFEFVDTLQPFIMEFPEEYLIEDFVSDTSINFVAIKVGDVNGSASGDLLMEVEERNDWPETTILTSDQFLEKGRMHTVRFQTEEASLAGFQFTIDFDPHLLEFVEIIPTADLAQENFGLNRLEQGQITLSWASTSKALPTEFAIQFQAKAAVHLSEALRLSSSAIRAEAYKMETEGKLELLSPVLEFREPEQVLGFQVFPNQPNPFSAQTFVDVQLPEAGQVELAVYAVDGRQVYSANYTFTEGKNRMTLAKSDLGESGIYYYHIRYKEHTVVQKMVLLE